MINLLGAALIGLSSPVSPHSVATLGLWPQSAPVVVDTGGRDSYYGSGSRDWTYSLPEDSQSLPASARIIILTAVALLEVLQ